MTIRDGVFSPLWMGCGLEIQPCLATAMGICGAACGTPCVLWLWDSGQLLSFLVSHLGASYTLSRRRPAVAQVWTDNCLSFDLHSKADQMLCVCLCVCAHVIHACACICSEGWMYPNSKLSFQLLHKVAHHFSTVHLYPSKCVFSRELSLAHVLIFICRAFNGNVYLHFISKAAYFTFIPIM